MTNRLAISLATSLACALACTGTARAHDTWLQPLPDTPRGERALALGTGERFPQHQSALPVQGLRDAACTALARTDEAVDASPALPHAPPPGPPPWPLRWAADRPDALWLRSTRAVPATRVLDCRVQMAPQAIELPAAAVAAYLDEARADAALRGRWQQLQQQGRPWRERFRKHARWIGAAPDAEPVPLPGPLVAGAGTPEQALDFDLRLQLPRWPLQRGDRLAAQLLLHGQPLPHHPVELRNALSGIGLWLHSDAEGRLALPLPLATRWMLRSIVLRPGPADDWDSHFLSVVFDVAPASPALLPR